MTVVRFYLHPKQKRFLRARQKRKTVVAGRGWGKNHAMGAHSALMQNDMPRAKILLGGLTYNQLFNVSLPPIEEAWNRMGLYEYDEKTKFGHYVIGKKPPSHFVKPYQNPRKSEYCIYFSNGFCIVMGSLDRPDSLRGGNYDGGILDESALIPEEAVNRVLLKMIRGSQYRPYANHYLHNSFVDFTSMPWTVKGQWVFKTEELSKSYPHEYFYMEGKTRDNIAVLGEAYLKLQKDTSSELEYLVECENYRLSKVPNSFYPSFDEGKHCVWRTYDYAETDSGLFVQDNFYNKGEKLSLSFDFNAAFTSMIVCQEKPKELRIVDEVFVTDYRTIDDLLDKFILKYENHLEKRIDIYGDRNGNNRLANSKLTFYQEIINKLQKHGWHCNKKVIGLDPEHKVKHRLIDTILREENDRLPRVRINQNNCKWLIVSIQNSPITLDFKKDKSSETRKLTDHRASTHLSDCFDSILYRICAKLVGITHSVGASTIASIV